MWKSNVIMGDNCHVHETVVFRGVCRLGDNVVIHPWSIIGGQSLTANLTKGDNPRYTIRRSGSPTTLEDFVTVLNHSTVQVGVHVGRGSVIGNKTHLGHHSKIGKYCRLHVGSVLSGHVTLEDGVVFEPGVYVAHRLTIGKGARIGMGSVVLKDVPAGELWYGSPAKKAGT